MRYLKSLLFLAVVILLMASRTEEAKLTEGTNPGSLAPKINVQGGSLKCDKYVLVQFWAAYDPSSRLKNVLMHNKITRIGNNNLKFMSISFDKSRSIFEETVRADKLNILTQLNDPEGESSEIFRSYRLENGFGNFLIDSNGVIIARDITPGELDQIKI